MSDVIESIEYKPDLHLDHDKTRSIKIVFQNEVELETNAGDLYQIERLYITWGKPPDGDLKGRGKSGVDSWVAPKQRRTMIIAAGMETVSQQYGVAPIEVLHGIIIAAHESNTNTDESVAEGEHVSGDSTDESEQSLTSRLYECTRELLTP